MVTIVAVTVFNSDRGVPLAVLILLAFVVGMEYVVKRTGFGRHVFAVGGNAEAARRAGIRVNGIRVAVFGIAGTMAAIGGIMAASRLLAVNQNSGGNELLLLAIAGPVIAGTSLFGGRGSVWTALTGALVIGSISNGMDLLALSSAVKFMVTGGVLLLAVLVDAIARKQRSQTGRSLSALAREEQRGADGAAEVAERGDPDRRRLFVEEEVLAHLLRQRLHVALAEAHAEAAADDHRFRVEQVDRGGDAGPQRLDRAVDQLLGEVVVVRRSRAPRCRWSGAVSRASPSA